jgi:hypothetical protein
MFIVSLMMWFAFPYTDFVDPTGVKRGFVSNVVNFVSVRDVFDDTVHQFGATYQDYTLHGDGETPDRTVKIRTFVPTGHSSAPEPDTASLSANASVWDDLEAAAHQPRLPSDAPQHELVMIGEDE